MVCLEKIFCFALSWKKKIFWLSDCEKKKKKKKHFEHICCLEKNILFCPEKNSLAFRLWKKFSGFLSEENKKKILRKKNSPPPPPTPEIQMVGPLDI